MHASLALLSTWPLAATYSGGDTRARHHACSTARRIGLLHKCPPTTTSTQAASTACAVRSRRRAAKQEQELAHEGRPTINTHRRRRPGRLINRDSVREARLTNIRVADRLREPYDPGDELIWSDAARFYLVGLGLRGQTALTELGAWDTVQSYCAEVVGRKDWAPGAGPDEGVERIFTDRPVSTQVIARDRMQGALYKVAREKTGPRFHLTGRPRSTSRTTK